ncbi:hypothetical protein GCM10007938_13410 [Vibrio zhanjiangensis]|uniref:Outer membrane protein beta-barrel domain-containing protein n=1 Tax=Vibrio zhanjiangensis TaxID=1046128 RepID=A0ABQ6EWM4_9VIBR|nr:outer membrane beta-barrel protein [Vibrio zhanjiangensis]GLT17563.1 hypothetical protein GCM10007938_13410 [Vibrio zhanjiangensis]
MHNKTVTLFALGALAVATFGASAENTENTYNYFVGFDLGTHINGKVQSHGYYTDYPSYESHSLDDSVDTDPSLISGVSGGVIINDRHRVKMSLAYDGLDIDGYSETIDRTDLTVSYDYMLPMTDKLSWTVGAHMGYEAFESDADYYDGFITGVQTGLDYRLTKNWSLGTEVAHTSHGKETFHYVGGQRSVQLKEDVTFMANVQYHF